MLSVTISDIAIITVKNVDYRCIIHSISKYEVINLLKNSVLEDLAYCLKFQSVYSRQFFFTFFILVYIKWLTVNIELVDAYLQVFKY